jgi:hypothetical protein
MDLLEKLGREHKYSDIEPKDNISYISNNKSTFKALKHKKTSQKGTRNPKPKKKKENFDIEPSMYEPAMNSSLDFYN